jgi:hypothetical protein
MGELKMSNELAKIGQRYGLEITEGRFQAIKNLIMNSKEGISVNDDELAVFLLDAKQKDLNPFNGEIHFMKTKKGQIAHLVDYKGLERKARESSRIVSWNAQIIREKDDFRTRLIKGVTEIEHNTVGIGNAQRGRIVGAYAIVEMSNANPIVFIANFQEFKKNTPIWTDYSEVMILKSAIKGALKRALNLDSDNEFTRVEEDYINGEVIQNIQSPAVINEFVPDREESVQEEVEYEQVEVDAEPEPVAKENKASEDLVREDIKKVDETPQNTDIQVIYDLIIDDIKPAVVELKKVENEIEILTNEGKISKSTRLKLLHLAKKSLGEDYGN